MSFRCIMRSLFVAVLISGSSNVYADLFKNKTGLSDESLIIRWFMKQGGGFKGSNTPFNNQPTVEKLKELGVSGFQVLLKSNDTPALTKQMVIDFNAQYELACPKGEMKLLTEQRGDQTVSVQWCEITVEKVAGRVSPPGGLPFEDHEKLTEPGAFYANNKNKKPYEILGVTENASEDEIKKAYKKLFLQWHPDKWQQSAGKTAQEEKDAADAFKLVSDAKEAMLKKPVDESLVIDVIKGLNEGTVDALTRYLEKGHKVDIVVGYGDPSYQITTTLLGLAVYFENVAAVKMLLAKGADKSALITRRGKASGRETNITIKQEATQKLNNDKNDAVLAEIVALLK